MVRVLKREAAKRDLIAHWVWYAEHADVEVADRFLAAAEKTLRSLAAHPQSGALTQLRSPGLKGIRRSSVGDGFGAILLFYLPIERGVDLIRVVHGRRDLTKLAKQGFFR